MEQATRLSGVRGLIARRMVDSLHSSAQLSFHARADASNALQLMHRMNRDGQPVSFEDLAAWVFVQCVKKHPQCNGLLQDRTFTRRDAVHLGLAVGIAEHLVVAVLPDAQKHDLNEFTQARRALIEKARNQALTAADMRGATITLSNLGKGRTEAFTPILNAPQVALLGVSAVLKRPWLDLDEQLCVRPVVGVSLTVDHQWIDGAPANALLTDYCVMLESVE